MKSILICPAARPEIAQLAETVPLAIAPLLGRTLIEFWIEALFARGVKHLLVLASDRPHQVREFLGQGARWGMTIEVVTQTRESSVDEARTRFRLPDTSEWLHDAEVILINHLPGHPDRPLFESYAGWFAAVQAFMPHAATPSRIGTRELNPGVWAGLHARIDPTAQLHAPCWIGEYTFVGAGAEIGPAAIVDDRVVIETGARVKHSVIGPDTFVGELVAVERSIAHGGTIVNWTNDSCLRVPDTFLLSSLADRQFTPVRPSLLGRALAALAMIATFPVAGAVMAWSLVRGDAPLILRLGVKPQRRARGAELQTFAYHELSGGRNWLRRWPQFWSIVRGDLTWVGNRPLRPTQVLSLRNDFQRLWLSAPAGIVSLADAYGCNDTIDEETCAHASYYAVNASRPLNWFVLRMALRRVVFAWPIRWTRRKELALSLRPLVHKPQA